MPGLARGDLDLLRFAAKFGDKTDERAHGLIQASFIGRAEDDTHARFAPGKGWLAADLDVEEAGLDIAEPLGHPAFGKCRPEGTGP